ncbi:hypothetical protein WDW86_09250 [Bdellovibrionota bacterium FG-2]
MIRFLVTLLIAWPVVFALVLPQAHAVPLALPNSVIANLLSESVPTAFAPIDFQAADFSIEWENSPPAGVRAFIETGSIQWVRVSEILVLPRARLAIEVDGAESGRVQTGGGTQAFEIQTSGGKAFIPVALISGPKNPIDLSWIVGKKRESVRAFVKFTPRDALKPPYILLDHTCSRYGLNAKIARFQPQQWVFIGCRFAEIESSSHRTQGLELFVFWDGVGETVNIGGQPTAQTSDSIWTLRLRAAPGTIRLDKNQTDFTLSYFAMDRWQRGNIALGVGPYSYSFSGAGEDFSTWTLFPTLYLSYFITESMRMVLFGASHASSRGNTDLGVYLSTEYGRILDKRVTINLMLGGHFIGFKSGGKYYLRAGAPQGMEVVVSDFLARGRNLMLGGFLYPQISGKSYTNVWLRWGSSQLFGEFNYIAWDENINDSPFASHSVGLTVGFPLSFARFL